MTRTPTALMAAALAAIGTTAAHWFGWSTPATRIQPTYRTGRPRRGSHKQQRRAQTNRRRRKG